MYEIVTTKSFAKALARIPPGWQKRIVASIREIAADPYATNGNLTKLRGRNAYRFTVGRWRVIYELQDEEEHTDAH